MWADWRGLIECEINKVSHSALQRPLNDLYEEDHQGFDGFVLGMKVLFAFSLYSLSFFFFFLLYHYLSNLFVCLPFYSSSVVLSLPSYPSVCLFYLCAYLSVCWSFVSYSI